MITHQNVYDAAKRDIRKDFESTENQWFKQPQKVKKPRELILKKDKVNKGRKKEDNTRLSIN